MKSVWRKRRIQTNNASPDSEILHAYPVDISEANYKIPNGKIKNLPRSVYGY